MGLPYRDRNPDIAKPEINEDTDANNNKSPNKSQGRGSHLQRMLATLRQSKRNEEKKSLMPKQMSSRRMTKLEMMSREEKQVIDTKINVITDNDKAGKDAKENKEKTKPKRTPITWP